MVPGSILDNSGYRQETLHHLERAKLMRIGTLSSDTYYWITLVHYHENRPWTLRKRHESFLNQVVQAQNSFMIGIILCSANRDRSMENYGNISNEQLRNLGIDVTVDLRWSMDYHDGYLRGGDYLGQKVISMMSHHISYCTKCKDNMAKIKDMQICRRTLT